MTRFLLLFLMVLAPPSSPAGADSPSPSPFPAVKSAAAKNPGVLDHGSPTDPALQKWLEDLDKTLRNQWGMTEKDTATGVLDLLTGRLALVRPDRIEYAASIAKIGILLAFFDLHPEAATTLPPETAAELGKIAKLSSNPLAAKWSKSMGLQRIQEVLTRHGFWDPDTGGGLWVGRHYGAGGERFGDPIADHSHAATVRQVMRFFQMMEQDELLSPAVSARMREIFDSPDLPHDPIKFVKALDGRKLQLRRKWGTWENWKHDAAAVKGHGRHYIVVALTHHEHGDLYLEKLAAAVDDFLPP